MPVLLFVEVIVIDVEVIDDAAVGLAIAAAAAAAACDDTNLMVVYSVGGGGCGGAALPTIADVMGAKLIRL